MSTKTKRSYKTWFSDEMYGIEGDEWIAPSIDRTSVWDQTGTSFIVSNLQENNVILDIGANIGYYSLLYSKIVGDGGEVYSYEAIYDIFEVLKINVDINLHTSNLKIHNQAVSNSSGTMEFTLFSRNPGASQQTSLWNDEDVLKNRLGILGETVYETRTAQSVILDKELLPQLQRLDFIKFDIEGGEGCALLGMSKILEKFPNVSIVAEFLLANDECDIMGTYRYLVNEKGYKMYVIAPAYPDALWYSPVVNDYYCLWPINIDQVNTNQYYDNILISPLDKSFGTLCGEDPVSGTVKSMNYGTDSVNGVNMVNAFQEALLLSPEIVKSISNLSLEEITVLCHFVNDTLSLPIFHENFAHTVDNYGVDLDFVKMDAFQDVLLPDYHHGGEEIFDL
jgi:FkbM family methyltransferase